MTARLSRKAVLARLAAAHDPVILIHVKPDGDAVGSAVALAHFYHDRGHAVSVLCADPIPARLSFLLDGLALAPYAGREGRTVLALDVASEGQLGSLSDGFGAETPPDFSIDHHEHCTPVAPCYCRPHAAATGEILVDLLGALTEPAGLTPPMATALFAAIASDTGCFRFPNATGATHRAAARLIDLGIDAGRVNHLLFESKTPAQLKAEAATADRTVLAADGRIAYASLDRALLDRFGEENFETSIDIVRAVAGVTIAFTLKEQQDGSLRVSLRATTANVAAVAALHGGGGHARAAGCTLRGTTAENAAEALVRELTPLA